jgi:hypothetical protein
MDGLRILILLGSALAVTAQVPSFWGCPEKNIPMPDFDLSKVSNFNNILPLPQSQSYTNQ